MQFPIDITFKMLGWHAQIHLTDGSGQPIAYVRFSTQRKGRLHIHEDATMGPPIFTIGAEHAFTHWFEDAAGRRFAEYGILPTAQGKFIIVEREPRFHFVAESEWLDFFDRIIPTVPVLNGLTGMFIRPRINAVRIQSGANVVRIVKQRMMIDIRYRLEAIEDVAAQERWCLVLSAIVYAIRDHSINIVRSYLVAFRYYRVSRILFGAR